jgi:hypothetical protein
MDGRTYFFPIGITDRVGEAPLAKIDQSIEALSAYVREYFPIPSSETRLTESVATGTATLSSRS